MTFDLRAWAARHGFNGEQAGEALGVDRATFYRYCTQPELPKWLVLACERLDDEWMPIETAPVGELVMVYSPPTPHNYPDDLLVSFDFIDPDSEDYWVNHGENYEHYCCVAKPEGSIGPKEKAPYTHWKPKPKPPTTSAPKSQEK